MENITVKNSFRLSNQKNIIDHTYQPVCYSSMGSRLKFVK